MAFKADHGLSLGGEFCQIKQFGGVAAVPLFSEQLLVLLNSGNRQTPGAVTRFTVYERQTCFRPDLLTMYAQSGKLPDFVMGVTFCNAVVIADVVSVKTPYDHLFVLSHREKRIGLPHFGTSAEQ